MQVSIRTFIVQNKPVKTRIHDCIEFFGQRTVQRGVSVCMHVCTAGVGYMGQVSTFKL